MSEELLLREGEGAGKGKRRRDERDGGSGRERREGEGRGGKGEERGDSAIGIQIVCFIRRCFFSSSPSADRAQSTCVIVTLAGDQNDADVSV